jgi:hypothetical protein
MQQIDFVNKNQSISLKKDTFAQAEEQTEAAQEPKITDDELCKDLLMMCMFSTYYSGFYPDMSMFR